MDFNKPFTYDPQRGLWHLELHKTPKDEYAQCGIKITINTGFPTGEKGAFYKTDEPNGLKGTNIEIRCFDNLSGWTSAVAFDLPTLIEKLMELMPKDKITCDTFVLAERDIETGKKLKEMEKQKNG